LWYHWKCVGIKGNLSDDAWDCTDCLMNAVDSPFVDLSLPFAVEIAYSMGVSG
jgi:hypothetical protein